MASYKKTKLLFLLPLIVFAVGCSAGGDPAPEPSPDPTGHNVSTAWDKDNTYHWHYCADPGCEEMFNKTKHTFEWVTTKQPTVDAKGVKSNKCTVCGYVIEKQDIPKLELHYSSSWSSDGRHHWHGCTDAGYEDKVFGKDIDEHTLINATAEVEPTLESPGLTASGTCSVCNATIEAVEIPILNDTNYSKTSVRAESNVLTETWTLKDASIISRDSYVVTKNYDYGYVDVDNYDTGKMVTTHCNYKDFNKLFPDIEMSVNWSTQTVTINVKKSSGVTLNNTCLIFPSTSFAAPKYIITGGPLTINAPKGVEDGTLKFSSSTAVAAMSEVIIDNNLTINYPSSYPSVTNGYAMRESILTINEGAKLTIKGYYYGIKAYYTPITVNGALDITTTNLAVVSNGSNARKLKFASGSKVYFNDVLQTSLDITDTTGIKNNSVKHLQVVPA